MATDSTELTFVRCPACRSLVPAVSTRCRMCGATLDASLGSEGTQPPSSGRVRQKTMTTSGSEELAEQIGRVREEMGEEPARGERQQEESYAASAETGGATDPLSGYLDPETDPDFEDFDEPPLEEELDEGDIFEDDIDDVDPVAEAAPVDDFFDDPREATNPEPEIAAEPEIEEAPVLAAEIPSAENSLEKAKEVVSTTATDAKREDSKPRVVVEQGKGRISKGGLSFGAKGGEPSQRRFDVPKEEQRAKAPEVRPEPVRRQEARREEPSREELPQEEARAPERKEKGAKAPKSPGKQLESTGRLFGWLVNYNEPNGSSIELREGRFFVTSSQLRPTDLVLDDSTISTPHAMFTIGLDTGMVIQDLKSDRGVFIREQDTSTYRREYESVELHHGDWVRFGDLEFLVSIIAHVGVK